MKTGSRIPTAVLAVPLLAAVFCVAPLNAQAPAELCCSITAIDSRSGLVTARDARTGESFEIRVTDTRLLLGLRVGQAVYVDAAGERAGFAPGEACCGIAAKQPLEPNLTRSGEQDADDQPYTSPSRDGFTVRTSEAQAVIGRLGAGERLVEPPDAAPYVPGSRSIQVSGTVDGRPAELAVTVTPAGDVVRGVAAGAAVEESRSWSDFWRTLKDRINACKRKYPDDEEKRIDCIDGAIIDTIIDWFTGSL